MLPTFVIGLREGVEASLIVGIIAAFLSQGGHRRELRWMWAGVGLALALCLGLAVGLQVLDQALPQRQQEMLETVVASVAVVMVSFMIIWMRRNAATISSRLRTETATAVAAGSAWALVAMAFIAVVREGVETAVFMLAAFQASGDSTAAGLGALFGILLASVIGYGIYRGGVRLNLDRFFRITAAVLVLVAAGLVSSAIHTAHEAAWLNSLQAQALDLSWLVRQGSVSSSLITGVFGIQPQPTIGETLGFLLYAVPMLVYVLWPRSVVRRPRAINTATGAVACVSLLVLAVLAAGCGSGSSSAGSGSGKQLNFTLTDAGCAPATSTVPAGPVTVNVSNGGTGKVSELELKNSDGIILGERENIVSGISGSFTLSLQPGDYVLNCPNGDAEDNGKLTVTGQQIAATAGPSTAKLAAATKGYQKYVIGQSAELVKGTQQFTAALKAGDLQKAKQLFGPTRIHYEAIEPVAESFGNLDPEIDARENDVQKLSDWTGFHRIEKILWQQNTTAGTEPYATKLMSDVNTLDSKVRTLTYQPAQLANGAVELLNEVANSKITGEEDRYSHTDLSDFAGNLQGAEVAFNLLAPALASTGNAQLVNTINQRFAAVHTTLDTYKRQTPLGYALYGDLTLADRKKLSQEINDLAEPLSTVAAKVSG